MQLELALLFLFLAIVSYHLNQNYTDSLEFRFKRYGDDTRPVVVVIPGLDGITAFFNDIVPEFTVHYNVIVYNIPLKFRGDSNYTFESIADNLHSLLTELGVEDVHGIVGESFGGIIAQHFQLMFPNKSKSLVLLSSLAKTELPPEVVFKKKYLLPIVKILGKYYPLFAQYLFARIHVYDVVEPSEPNYVRDLFIKEASVAHFDSVIARIEIALNLNIISRVSAIHVPTLIIYGQDDHFTKENSMELHNLIAGSELRSLPGGHLAHVSHPKEFAELVISFFNLRA